MYVAISGYNHHIDTHQLIVKAAFNRLKLFNDHNIN